MRATVPIAAETSDTLFTKTSQEKDVCVKEAKVAHVKLVADAKAQKTAVNARAEAREDTREAAKRNTK